MAQFSDLISRIFSADRTQGLSGGAEVVIDQDPASAFYATRLRKHRTDEDLIESPEFFWATASYQGRKGGLRAHIHAERGDGVASFTDVLIILNRDDALRADLVTGEPWSERAARALSARFEAWCQKEGFELLYPSRPVRFRFVSDGNEEMLQQSLGLGPGEYITGLLPNLYAGPGASSRAALAVHLNLPGVWEGYREVGRLYNDQILFTLGRHWLDNFHHPSLREPGLYRLQQYPDGALVHVISPELQDRYLVRSDSVSGGASVLTIAQLNGEPVAYLVLAVVDTAVHEAAASGDRAAAPAAPVTAEEVSEPDAVDRVAPSIPAAPPPREARSMLQRTIVPGLVEARILTLQERGALLQKVHFANFMEGYDVYIGANGRIATQMTEPKAILQVRGNRVSLVVNDPGVLVGGRAATIGKATVLRGETTLEVDGSRIQYRDLSDVKVEGWPYLGELRRPGAGAYLEFGASHRLGRDRRCKVRLPDEPHNENIAWLPSVGGGTTIRSRTGDIPKSRFYTDSIMVASEHAEIDLGEEPILRSLARHCFTFVRRGGEILPLHPREGSAGRQDITLQPNDEVLVGNCLFQVSFLPPGQMASARTNGGFPEALRMPLSPADLAGAVDTVPPAGPGDDERVIPRLELPATLPPLASEPPLSTTAPVGIHMPPSPAVPSPAPAPASERGVPEPSAPSVAAPAVKASPRPDPMRRTVDPVAAGGLGEFGPPPRPVVVPRAERGGGAGARRADAPDASRRPPPPMLIETFEGLDRISEGPTAPVTPVAPASPAGPVVAEPVVVPLHLPDPPVPEDEVVSVEEAEWTLELSRPGRIVQVGWMVSGEVVIGNHRGAQVIVPEVRAFRDQAFMTLDYFRLFVRGRKGKVELLQEGEARIRVAGVETTATESMDQLSLEVVRRDANLEPDFDVRLTLVGDASLPDPRARLLWIDPTERLVSALFTLGCPLRSDRRVRLGSLVATVSFDGQTLKISDYIASYRTPVGGYRPFFHGGAGRPYRTFPEDGAPVVLQLGETLIIGLAVYRFGTE